MLCTIGAFATVVVRVGRVFEERHIDGSGWLQVVQLPSSGSSDKVALRKKLNC